MSGLRSGARKYGVAASTSLRNRLAYLGNFVGSLLTYALFVFVFSRIWTNVFAARGVIAGYDRVMCTWYFLMAEVPTFGFGHFFFSLARDMRSGQVAYLVSRPYSFVIYHFADRMGAAMVESGCLLVLGLCLGLAFTGVMPVHSVGQAVAVLLSLVLSGSLYLFFQFAIAMTAFWIEENSAFWWIVQKFALVVGTLMPIEFLPEAAQRIAWFTPFPYVAWAPARMTVAFDPSQACIVLGVQTAWLAAGAAICRLVFALGRRKMTTQGG